MKKLAMAGYLVALLAGATACAAQDAPQAPFQTKEHQWLQELVGQWDGEGEAYVAPGQPPIKAKGVETVRNLGGYWIVAEGKATMMDMPFNTILTMGYDVDKKKFVGTWIDSVSTNLWKYEGTLDSTGKILTLETEGPNPRAPGKLARFREVMEIKSKDHRVFTSSMQGEDGKWTPFGTINYRRKK